MWLSKSHDLLHFLFLSGALMTWSFQDATSLAELLNLGSLSNFLRLCSIPRASYSIMAPGLRIETVAKQQFPTDLFYCSCLIPERQKKKSCIALERIGSFPFAVVA